MKKLAIVHPSGRNPVLCHYSRQNRPQPAYIELNTRNGRVSADYNAEIGNAVPSAIWHGHVRRFGIDPHSTCRSIRLMVSTIRPHLETVLNGAEEFWNGNNWVTRLSEEALRAEEFIHQTLAEWRNEP